VFFALDHRKTTSAPQVEPDRLWAKTGGANIRASGSRASASRAVIKLRG